jgi:hypothetical protein
MFPIANLVTDTKRGILPVLANGWLPPETCIGTTTKMSCHPWVERRWRNTCRPCWQPWLAAIDAELAEPGWDGERTATARPGLLPHDTRHLLA